MKKHIFVFVGAVAALFICLVVYFRPFSFLKVVRADGQLKMVLTEMEVRHGETYMDSTEYQAVTAKQKDAVLDLMGKYPYRRTLGTLRSDGSISGLGDRLLSIYVYDASSPVGSIFVSSSGKIAVNGKSFRMKNAGAFIQQIIEIVGAS